MAEYLNPIAEVDNPDSGKIINPKDAYQLRKTNKFFCPDHDCLDKERVLIPSRSKLKNYFFKHKAECKHNISPQTLLHKLAIKWFENKENFEIPSFNSVDKVAPNQVLKINYSKTQLEYRRLQKIIPDVKLTSVRNFQFAVEVIVTNDVGEDKIKLIEHFDLPTIRIDLAEFYEENKERCRNDYDFVIKNLNQLLTNINLKSWVVTPKDYESQGKIELNEKPKKNALGWLIGVGAFFIIYLIKKYKK